MEHHHNNIKMHITVHHVNESVHTDKASFKINWLFTTLNKPLYIFEWLMMADSQAVTRSWYFNSKPQKRRKDKKWISQIILSFSSFPLKSQINLQNNNSGVVPLARTWDWLNTNLGQRGMWKESHLEGYADEISANAWLNWVASSDVECALCGGRIRAPPTKFQAHGFYSHTHD